MRPIWLSLQLLYPVGFHPVLFYWHVADPFTVKTAEHNHWIPSQSLRKFSWISLTDSLLIDIQSQALSCAELSRAFLPLHPTVSAPLTHLHSSDKISFSISMVSVAVAIFGRFHAGDLGKMCDHLRIQQPFLKSWHWRSRASSVNFGNNGRVPRMRG